MGIICSPLVEIGNWSAKIWVCHGTPGTPRDDRPAVYTMIIINHAFYVILGSQCAGKKVLGGAENTLGCAACLSTVAFSCSYTTKTGRRTFWTHFSVLNNLNYINMPKLVLHYFDFPFWRAEVCRLALHLGKVSSFYSKVSFKIVSDECHFVFRLNLKTRRSKV